MPEFPTVTEQELWSGIAALAGVRSRGNTAPFHGAMFSGIRPVGREARNPRLRLRAVAGRSSNPLIRLEELRLRQRDAAAPRRTRTMSGRQALAHVRWRAAQFGIERRGDVIAANGSTAYCGACGRAPVGHGDPNLSVDPSRECRWCGAEIPPEYQTGTRAWVSRRLEYS